LLHLQEALAACRLHHLAQSDEVAFKRCSVGEDLSALLLGLLQLARRHTRHYARYSGSIGVAGVRGISRVVRITGVPRVSDADAYADTDSTAYANACPSIDPACAADRCGRPGSNTVATINRSTGASIHAACAAKRRSCSSGNSTSASHGGSGTNANAASTSNRGPDTDAESAAATGAHAYADTDATSATNAYAHSNAACAYRQSNGSHQRASGQNGRKSVQVTHHDLPEPVAAARTAATFTTRHNAFDFPALGGLIK
jgi:hypothetical protein